MNDVIKLLSANMSNMIAAGEVIERPASVIKELIENSLDAHATKIEINLKESGITEIIVVDNGIGMSKNDIKMSLKRHATSKINQESDLFNLKTLGFRGEAIPSIASVSLMSIASKNAEVGYEVVVKASNIIKENEIAMNTGTIIKVNQLFFNTPARLKYLKSVNTELSIISDLVMKFALANPNVYFRLTNDKKEIFKTNGNNDLVSLISQFYGFELANNLLKIDKSEIGFKINGYISNSKIYKSKKIYINFIVNGRIIKNYILTEKLINCYQSFIPVMKYPFALIFINIDPFLIDVNIHPTKKEIKFSNENKVYEILEKTILDALYNYNPLINETIVNNRNYESEKKVDTPIFNNFNYDKIYGDFSSDSLLEEKNEEEQKFEIKNNIEEKNNNNLNNKINDLISNPKNKIPFLEYIGQYRGTYLLFQDDESLYLIDQHAAQERIRYELYLKGLENIKNEKQDLLIPVDIEVDPSEYIFIKDNLDKFNDLGIEICESGINSFFIRSVPYWLKDDIKENINNLINFIYDKKSLNITLFKDEIAKKMACKSSIKANQYVRQIEALKLIEDLNKCNNPFNCPHGRPVFIKFKNYEIEKMFKRVI